MTNERRCTAGQTTRPTDDDCNRHGDHHWCGYCAGYYGVQHSIPVAPCHTTQLLTMASDEWHRIRSHATCACRFCRLSFSSSEADAVRILTAGRDELPAPEPVVVAVPLGPYPDDWQRE